jgi:hypothetical protein
MESSMNLDEMSYSELRSLQYNVAGAIMKKSRTLELVLHFTVEGVVDVDLAPYRDIDELRRALMEFYNVYYPSTLKIVSQTEITEKL